MKKVLLASLIIASLFVAGCNSGGGGEPGPETPRLTEEQAKDIMKDAPPEARAAIEAGMKNRGEQQGTPPPNLTK